MKPLICILWVGDLLATAPPTSANEVCPASGPLRAHPTNSRYFTDDGQRAILMTGLHTWDNLVDMGRDDPPEPFDFEAYLDNLQRYNHNFIRLWAWDSTVWDTQANGSVGKDFIHHAAPQPWMRTGPGVALDGKPKFDLTQFNPDYFERLRTRVHEAGERGIYVSVMLFEGWGLFHGNRRRTALENWAWNTHPFHPDNNINGVPVTMSGDGVSGIVHRSGNSAVNALQAAYIRKVVDTVNDLDNVLYEVINEGGEKEWDWWVVETLHAYEQTKPKQHPVGITGHGAERVASMLASPAEWVSPGSADGYKENPPAWHADKISLLDTDHVWGIGGSSAWVWKAFLRGHNPLFMDPYEGKVLGTPGDTQWEPVRQAMGVARKLSGRVRLAEMTPRDELASTGFCLAHPGAEYAVYLPEGGACAVTLLAGSYQSEWLNPVSGAVTEGGAVTVAEGNHSFTAPFEGDAVLYLKRIAHSNEKR